MKNFEILDNLDANNWQVECGERFKKLSDEMKKPFVQVKIYKVKAHSKIVGNEIANEQAKEHANKPPNSRNLFDIIQKKAEILGYDIIQVFS